jgi:putative transposase
MSQFGRTTLPYWRLFYHLVWATHKRELLITDEEEQIIRRSFQLTCGDMGLHCHAAGVMPDHVHVALSVPPRHSVSEVMKRLKGASSHAVRTTHPGFTWQSEYGALSFGERALPQVCAYVLNQAEHHRNGTVLARLERVEPIPD